MCAKGVADFVKCSCIEFKDDDKLNDVIDLLKNVTDLLKGETNENITTSIDDIQNNIDDLTKYIQDNQNNLNLTYISDRISYMRKQLIALTLTVDAFKSTLVANTNCPNVCTNNYLLQDFNCTCTCTLNCAAAQIKNWRYCQCVDYSEAEVLYSLDAKILDLLETVSYDTVNATITEEYLNRLYTLEDRLYQYTATLEYEAIDEDLTLQTPIIRHYEELITNITTEYTEYVESRKLQNCSLECTNDQILVIDCTCFESAQVDSYLTILDAFVVVEYNIQSVGNSSKLEELVANATNIRELFQELYEYFFYNPGKYDTATIQLKLDEIQRRTDALIADLNEWTIENTLTTTCELSCSPTEIENLKACSCVLIVDWDELSKIQDGLDLLNIDIEKLDIDSTNKQILKDNS